MVLVMDERLQPSYITVSYDDISDLANEDHTQAFFMSAQKFFEKLLELFHEEIEIKLPANFYAAYPDGGWIPLKALLAKAEDFLTCLYYMDDFEFTTHLKTASNQYLLSIYTDPVAYNVKRVKSISNQSKMKRFSFLGWFKSEK